MKSINSIIFGIILFLLFSCKHNCSSLPNNYNNYDDAKKMVLNSSFKFSETADVSDSPWISSASFYSCDNLYGYYIIEINGKKYIYQNMSIDTWDKFKNATSKGSFYSTKIKGNYLLQLK